MTHTAEIVKGSIKPLGSEGITFQVWCCHDSETVESHTLMHAHAMDTTDLQTMIERKYLRRAEEKHAAVLANAEHIRLMAGEENPGACENCQ